MRWLHASAIISSDRTVPELRLRGVRDFSLAHPPLPGPWDLGSAGSNGLASVGGGRTRPRLLVISKLN